MRDDLDDYFGDVTYRVWISGGNPDEVDLDRVGESHWDGDDADACQVQALERIADGLELVAHHAARLQQFVECLNGTLGHTNEILNRIALAKGG